MRRCVIEIEPVFLYVLAVIALVAGESEHPLFENRVAAIPERERENQQLVTVANARDAVFTPAISLATRHVMRKKLPRATVGTALLAHASPRTLTDIWPPLAPGGDHFVGVFSQPLVFRG